MAARDASGARRSGDAPAARRGGDAVAALDELTRVLRRACPWDREQDERSIVPHTVEEAYELADAAYAGDDAKLLDELGDVLFQVHFLALLLEERGAGDLAQVAEHCQTKLIRRHPHVFGEHGELAERGLEEVVGSAEVRRNWEEIKRTEPGRAPGLFDDVPEALPALLWARKLLRRAERVTGSLGGGSPARLDRVREQIDALASLDGRDERFVAVGQLLLAVVELARTLDVDPELALRTAARRLQERVSAPAGGAGSG